MFSKLYPPLPDFQPLSRGAQALLSNERWAQYIIAEHDFHRIDRQRKRVEDFAIGTASCAVFILIFCVWVLA